ncbi:LacI family transcriptional regulator [Actinomadura sp. ATCC 31491]|uniref:LacI family transcriptional regulator n=1 Tax=Actinomadura luzonensis TaxID=2805427 RepID=A0ABT0FUN2_9ACTN|nr:LacI family DNA-binding transcriptional regulator [Actinomadura luzonensis]MCK2216042.1 LacI family transcriptional regulator [Actinomadura luzonensis]
MAHRTTVYDVAERAGVSIATVSHTFRQPERVRPETRELVLAAARALGYVPSGSARGLAKGRSQALGLYAFDMFLPSDVNAPALSLDDLVRRELDGRGDARRFPLYVDEIQHGFEIEARRLGRTVMLGAGASRDSLGSIDLAGSVDGLAIFPGSAGRDLLEHVGRGVPVVIFSSPPAHDPMHHITVANEPAVRELVDHLVGHHGHRSVAFLGELAAPDIGARFRGFQAALAAHGLPVSAEPFDATAMTQDSLRPLRAAIAAGDLPRALVCATDQLALAVLDLLARHGLRVPEDVAVTGFDGIVAGRLSEPSLTTIRQPFASMGRLAVRILTDTIAGREHPRSYVLPTRLVLGGSCGCG